MSRARNAARRAGWWQSGTATRVVEPDDDQADGEDWYTAEPSTAHRYDPIDVEIRHGYRLSDINRMARQAAGSNLIMAADSHDLYDLAWSAIAEAVWSAEEPPSVHDLATVGRSAIWTMVKDHRTTYGYRERRWDAGVGSAPRFAAYWHVPAQMDPMDAVVERIAVGQVLAGLTELHQQTLAAYATTGDREQTAVALGIRHDALNARLQKARRIATRLWWQGETPRVVRMKHPDRRQDRRPIQPCGTTAAAQRHRARKETLCPPCARAEREYDRARRERRKARTAT